MRRIAIIGLGLIGGSLGLAMKQASPEMEIVGFTRTQETATRAKSRGAVDRIGKDLASTVAQASLVFIATPVLTIKEILQGIAPHLSPNSIVSDTGSTKEQVLQWAEEYLPPTVCFIGGHPMAGKETWGINAADASLFTGCAYCLTPAPNATIEGVQSLVEMVELIGAEPLFIDAAEHDNLVAGVSHLPLLLSCALVSSTMKSPQWPEMSRLAASGFGDLSRLASGEPGMNRDICLTNQASIARWLDDYISELREYRRLVIENGEELAKKFAQAREAHQKWLQSRASGSSSSDPGN